MASASPIERYGVVLSGYLNNPGEQALYDASLLSRDLVHLGVGPEEIIALHVEALEASFEGFTPREQSRYVGLAHQFLLEVMIAYGVTYREYLEMKIKERDTAAALADTERTELLATVAHEMRNPISAALGTIDLARRNLSQGRTERVPTLLETARTALNRMSRLTADLARATQGELPELHRNPYDLAALLDEACTWASPAAEARQIALIPPEHLGSIPIIGDGDAILSIFGNLLSNAIRYTPPGGEIRVTCGTADGEAWVAVADTGIGMSSEVMVRIFDKFYRAREARDIEAQGLGLGLALVREFVDAHGGRVEVRSEVGRGSTFCVYLPRDGQGVEGEDGFHRA
ncbi:MAG: ATP-binding protein [Thermomicrobiales bacterium]